MSRFHEAGVKLYPLYHIKLVNNTFSICPQHILDREENWISWKNEGCPSFIKERSVSVKVQITTIQSCSS